MEATKSVYTKYALLKPQQGQRIAPTFGANSFLETLGRNGSDAGIVTMSTSLAIMLLRPLVIMLDKNATKDEKTYAASWIFGLSAVGLAAQALLKRPFDKIAGNLAKNFIKTANANALNGATEVIKFGLYNAAAVVYTYLNSRYIGRVIDKFVKKPSNTQKPLTEEQKANEKKKDKIILGSFLAAGSFILLNVIGRKLTGKSIASDAVAKFFSKTNTFLDKNFKIFSAFKDFAKTKSDQLLVFLKNKTEWFAKQSNVRDSWITRNMLANSIVRPIIALLSGQPYLAVRCFMDEGVGALIMKLVGDPTTKAAVKPLSNLFGNPKSPLEIEGIKVLAGQLVKNIGILCIGLGLLNNSLSKKFVNMFSKNDNANQKDTIMQKEHSYKEFKKNYIPALAPSDRSIEPGKAKNMQEWLMAINSSSYK